MLSIPDDVQQQPVELREESILFDAGSLKPGDTVSVFFDGEDESESGWHDAKVVRNVDTGIRVNYTKDNTSELIRWDTPDTTTTTRIRPLSSTNAMCQGESKGDDGDGRGGGSARGGGGCRGGGGRGGGKSEGGDGCAQGHSWKSEEAQQRIDSLLGELRTFEEKNICDSLANLYVSKLRQRNPERDCTFDKRTLDFKRY